MGRKGERMRAGKGNNTLWTNRIKDKRGKWGTHSFIHTFKYIISEHSFKCSLWHEADFKDLKWVTVNESEQMARCLNINFKTSGIRSQKYKTGLLLLVWWSPKCDNCLISLWLQQWWLLTLHLTVWVIVSSSTFKEVGYRFLLWDDCCHRVSFVVSNQVYCLLLCWAVREQFMVLLIGSCIFKTPRELHIQ